MCIKKTHNINILVYPLKIHKPPGIKTCNLGVLHLRMDFSLLNLQKEKENDFCGNAVHDLLFKKQRYKHLCILIKIQRIS